MNGSLGRMHWRDAGIALKSRSLNRIHRVANRQVGHREPGQGARWHLAAVGRFLECAKEYNRHR